MEIRTGACPLGSKCENVIEEDNRQILIRCPWFVKIEGKNPQSEEQFDEWRCAIAWGPILQVENAQQTRQAGAAIESLRNETVKGQNNFLNLLQTRRQEAIESH